MKQPRQNTGNHPDPLAGAPPAPRLQLRWEGGEEKSRFTDMWGKEHVDREWRCFYELVMPLDEFDIRHEIWKDGEQVGTRDELVIAMGEGCTKRGATKVPCDLDDGTQYADDPFRDGAHAQWDAKLLGGLPVYVIAPDGIALKVERPERAEAAE